MNPFFPILRLFIINNEVYNKYFNIINIQYIKDNYKDLYKIFRVIPLAKEQKPEWSVEDFSLFFFSQYPGMKPDDVEIFIHIFDRINNAEANSEEVEKYLESYKSKEVSTKIALAAIAYSEGRGEAQEILELVGQLERPPELTGETSFVTDDLKEIYAKTLQNKGLRWRLNTLNKMLGSLRRGNFGFIFARPETGKTTFLADQVSFFSSQLGSPCLWINNEEDGPVVMSRCFQAALGVDTEALYRNIDENSKRFKELTHGNIRILDDANASKKQIESICADLKPGLIIFDQIDKIRGFDEERYDLKMKEIYRWARGLAKTYGPVIGVCQAGGTAEGKKWLTMNDVDSSHTAKQGEADFILGIGKVPDEAFEGERYLHLSKNKLPGDEDSIPALRHGKCPVIFRPDIARYEDRLKW